MWISTLSWYREITCNSMRLRISLALGLSFLVPAAFAQEATPTVAKVLSGLALIVNRSGPEPRSGTGFCFWSTESKSYFLTNHHVVKDATTVEVKAEFGRIAQSPFVSGRVYPSTSPYSPEKSDTVELLILSEADLAVVVIDVGKVPPLKFGGEPKIGQPIGIVGFPSFQFAAAANLQSVSPSVHFGTVNSIVTNPTMIEYDALTDHGNSGGPMFDRDTGLIYGVVTLGIQSQTSQAVQNNLAIGSSTAMAFLQRTWLPAWIPFGPAEITSMPCMMSFSNKEGQWFCGLRDSPTGADLRSLLR